MNVITKSWIYKYIESVVPTDWIQKFARIYILALKHVFTSNILIWLCRFTKFSKGLYIMVSFTHVQLTCDGSTVTKPQKVGIAWKEYGNFQLTFALFITIVWFVSRHALAASGEEDPMAILVAQVLWRLLNCCVVYAGTISWHNRCFIETGRRVREYREFHCDGLAHNIVNSNRKQRRAPAFIEESEVHTLLREGDITCFNVAHHIVIIGECPVSSNNVFVFIHRRAPCWIRRVRNVWVALIVEEFKWFFALLKELRVGELGAATHCKRHLNVETFRIAPCNKRGAQPVLDFYLCHLTHRVDALCVAGWCVPCSLLPLQAEAFMIDIVQCVWHANMGHFLCESPITPSLLMSCLVEYAACNCDYMDVATSIIN